jgi:hypothetical protein
LRAAEAAFLPPKRLFPDLVSRLFLGLKSGRPLHPAVVDLLPERMGPGPS